MEENESKNIMNPIDMAEALMNGISSHMTEYRMVMDENRTLSRQLHNVKEQRNEFQKYLSLIAHALDIAWWDCAFPLDEVLTMIGDLRK